MNYIFVKQCSYEKQAVYLIYRIPVYRPTPLDRSYSAFTFIEGGYQCYYCNDFKTDNKGHYKSHVRNEHGVQSPYYPNKADLERLGLKPQEKSWEI
jgi:hypothetical protein